MRSALSTFIPSARIAAAVLLVGALFALSSSGPAVLIGSLPHPDDVAIDGPNAYVTSYDPAKDSQATLFEVPVAGGAARRVATLAGLPITGMAVRAATVYFTQAGSGKVWFLPLDTLQPHLVASGQQEPWAIAADRTHVYFTTRGTMDHADGAVVRVPAAGGPVQVIAAGLHAPQHLALDDANVYVTDLGSREHDLMDGAVVRIPKGGGPAVVLAAEQRIVTGLAADGKSVYWTSEARRGDEGRVIRFDLAGGRLVVLASGEGSPGGIALDETTVFWTCYNGLVRKVGKQGGKSATVASAQVRPYEIAVGASAIVWANLGKVDGERELPGALMALRR